VTSLKKYIVSHGHTRRPSRMSLRPMREDAGEVQMINSRTLDTATVALPARIDLDDRAARRNEFWRALVEFQYREVLVVALCAGDEL
jgi:hypothetical protein